MRPITRRLRRTRTADYRTVKVAAARIHAVQPVEAPGDGTLTATLSLTGAYSEHDSVAGRWKPLRTRRGTDAHITVGDLIVNGGQLNAIATLIRTRAKIRLVVNLKLDDNNQVEECIGATLHTPAGVLTLPGASPADRTATQRP